MDAPCRFHISILKEHNLHFLSINKKGKMIAVILVNIVSSNSQFIEEDFNMANDTKELNSLFISNFHFRIFF